MLLNDQVGPVLGFDTSAKHLCAAVVSNGACLAQNHIDLARGQDQQLFSFLKDILQSAGVDWQDLARVGVGVGPGNFTGVRIGVSAARGIAMGLGIPAVGVTMFEALRCGQTGVGYAAVAGPRGQFYWDVGNLWDANGPIQPALLGPEEVPSVKHSQRADPYFVGPETAPWAKLIWDRPSQQMFSTAEAIARVAAGRDLANLPPPTPLYIKPADAAPSRIAAPVIVA